MEKPVPAEEPVSADIEGLKRYIGGVVLDLYQARGVVNAAAIRIAQLEKENAELKAPKKG